MLKHSITNRMVGRLHLFFLSKTLGFARCLSSLSSKIRKELLQSEGKRKRSSAIRCDLPPFV